MTEQKMYAMSLPEEGWNVVMRALAARPYAEVAAIVTSLQQQYAKQYTPPEEEEKVEVEE